MMEKANHRGQLKSESGFLPGQTDGFRVAGLCWLIRHRLLFALKALT